MRFKVNFSESNRDFKIKISESIQDFKTSFGELQLVKVYVGDPYDGTYEVTPKIIGQVLPTKEKILHQDLLINAIPYAETTNTSNGITVTIG